MKKSNEGSRIKGCKPRRHELEPKEALANREELFKVIGNIPWNAI
jgi:hypothetical protein